jgi:beta-glucanase (GH16 family)
MSAADMPTRRAFLLGTAGMAGAALAAGCSAPPAHRPRIRTKPRYTFDSEFTGRLGNAPDPALWSQAPNPNLSGGIQTYTDSRQTSFLDGAGHLVISAQPDSEGGYTSARLTTLGLFSQFGGWFEARIKLDAGQPGCWPAFWLVGQDIDEVGWPWCGEVDILEDFGTKPPTITSTVHVPSSTPTTSDVLLRTTEKFAVLPSDSDWHTYAMYWNLDGQSFTFYRDGASYFSVGVNDFDPAFWVYGPGQKNNGGMSIILNLAVGGYVGKPHPSHWPVQMYVDYVHVWQ